MKNILLLVFTFLSFSTFAQSNELTVSYQSFRPDLKKVLKDPPIRKGIALNFYKSINNKSAIGVKMNATQLRQLSTSIRFRSLGLDVTNRRTFLKKYNVRIMGEFGIAVRRDYSELLNMEELYKNVEISHSGNSARGGDYYFPRDLITKEDYPDQEWFKSNHYGLTSGLSIDYTIKNRIIIGTSYGYNVYWTTNEKIEDKKSRRLNLNINLGYKF